MVSPDPEQMRELDDADRKQGRVDPEGDGVEAFCDH
jgi:hypothetical protein